MGALLGIRGRGELGNQQQVTADVGDAEVHSAAGVGKDAVAEHPLAQPCRVRRVVTILHPTSTSRPRSMAPMASPSTTTLAWATRRIRPIISNWLAKRPYNLSGLDMRRYVLAPDPCHPLPGEAAQQ